MIERIGQWIGTLSGHRPSLAPERIWNEELDRDIAELPEEGAWRTVKAGLHLWNESLERSHELAQELPDRTGSYWHGLMHRMEPDYDNARYWFHRVSDHPAYADVQRAAAEYLRAGGLAQVAEADVKGKLESIAGAARWQPFVFIDAVERHMSRAWTEKDAGTESVLREIQRLEIKALLAYCTGLLD